MSITVTTNEGVETDAAIVASSEIEPETANESESDDGENENEESDSQEKIKDEESEQESEPDDDENSDDTEENESDDEPESDEETEKKEELEEPKPVKRSGFKKRIDKLNKRVADRDAMISNLQHKLDARNQGETNSNQDLSASLQKASNEDESKPEHFGLKRPVADDFEDYDAYIEELTDFKYKFNNAKDKAETQKVKAQDDHVNEIKGFQDKVKTFSATVEDFNDVIEDVDDIIATPELQRAILESDNGPELMYKLAKNPDEYKRVNQLSRVGIERAFGRMEGVKSTPKQAKKVLKKSQAPKPLEKVGTKGKGYAKSIHDDDLSQSEYEEMRNKQIKERKARNN